MIWKTCTHSAQSWYSINSKTMYCYDCVADLTRDEATLSWGRWVDDPSEQEVQSSEGVPEKLLNSIVGGVVVCTKGHVYNRLRDVSCPACAAELKKFVASDEFKQMAKKVARDLYDQAEVAAEPPPPPTRPSWDEIWMSLAGALALRSTCSRSSVGCVVVSTDNSTVLGLGYNGGPKGGKNACRSLEPGQCGHIHAEFNALLKANYRDASARKAYLTLTPCVPCATALVNFGIDEVVYRDEYRDLSGLKVLTDAGIRVRRFPAQGVPPRDLYLEKDG